MSRTTRAPQAQSDRAALRRRVLKMIRDLNAGRWDECFEAIDPKLREKGTPDAKRYADQLEVFRGAYGRITPWHTRISLHTGPAKGKTDARPFAYVYVVWKDAANEFHLFRER
jgi:malate synthase